MASIRLKNRSRRLINRSQRFKNLSTVAATAVTALKLATTVAGLVNVEFKNHDVLLSENTSTTATITPLTQIAQGDGHTNRDGESIRLKSINVMAVANQHGSADTTRIRVIIVMDTMQDGTAPTVTEILESNSVDDFKNEQQKTRFVFLKDWFITFGDKTMWKSKFYKKLDIKSHYTTSAAADTQGNHLYLLTLGNEATNVTPLRIRTRIKFIDN